MSLDKKLIAIIAVIIAVAAIAAYTLLESRQSQQAVVTTSSNTTSHIVKASSLSGCGDGPAVAVVYAPGQENLAEKIAQLLEQQLGGHIPPGSRYCVAPAGPSGLGNARVLPLILVRATNVSAKLSQLLLNKTLIKGFQPVRYDVDAVFAVRVSMQYHLPSPVYGATAKAIIVEPRTALASLKPEALEKQKQLLSLIEAVFAAKISSVEASNNIDSLDKAARPSLVLESSTNLAEGNPAVKHLGGNLYAAKDIDFAHVFLQRGLVEAIEVERSAKELGLEEAAKEHPTIGSGKIHLAVFEDFMCPFCARFYNETFPVLEEKAHSGKLQVHLMDLIVHQQGVVPKLHRLLLCYYLATGNSTGYLVAAKEIYRLLGEDLARLQKREINETSLIKDYEDLYQRLEEKLGTSPNCSKAPQLITRSARVAQALGITGTPGFAAWREDANYVVVTEGFRTAEFFNTLLEQLSQS